MFLRLSTANYPTQNASRFTRSILRLLTKRSYRTWQRDRDARAQGRVQSRSDFAIRGKKSAGLQSPMILTKSGLIPREFSIKYRLQVGRVGTFSHSKSAAHHERDLRVIRGIQRERAWRTNLWKVNSTKGNSMRRITLVLVCAMMAPLAFGQP